MAVLAAKAESGNNSSVRRIEALEIAIGDLVLEEPFQSLFAIREDIKNAIRFHMQEHGYDESKPVDVWKRPSRDGFDYVLVDGFTRTQAAKEAGRLTVTAYLHAFANVEEARDYAIHTQRDRRNLSDAEIMAILSVVDRKVTGFKGASPLASSEANGEPLQKTARRTAREIGTSVSKVEKARKVSTDPEIAAAVKRGEISINRGYNEIRVKERQEPVSSDALAATPDAPRAELGQDSGPTTEMIDLAPLIARLRRELRVEVNLSVDNARASCSVSLHFVSRHQFAEIVERICAPRA
ncbi:MAG: hypothetical protein ABSG63_10075 [Spirochaetia bacterium]